MTASIRKIENYAKLRDFCATPAGKSCTLAVFFILFQNNYDATISLELTVFIAVATYAPRLRHVSLFVCTQVLIAQYLLRDGVVGFLNDGQNSHDSLHLAIRGAAVICVISLFTFFCWLTSRGKFLWLAKYPVRTNLIIGVATFYVLRCFPQPSLEKAVLYSFLFFWNWLFWYFAYALRDARKFGEKTIAKTPAQFFQLGLPCNFVVPYTKGPAHLAAIEAKSAVEFSTIQLRALKLAFWVICLNVFDSIYSRIVTTGVYLPLADDYFKLPAALGIPSVPKLLDNFVHGRTDTLLMSWAAIFSASFVFVLHLAILSHPVIAILRMFGFAAPRNVYKPLTSTTLADYWNRVYYYFKELMVEFFFYPAYFRFFKKSPKARLFFATFMAATVGNYLWHYTKDLTVSPDHSLFDYTLTTQTYAVYCLILGISIAISQLRYANKPKPPPSIWRSSLVFGYYSLLGVIAWPQAGYSVFDYLRFYGRIFGIN